MIKFYSPQIGKEEIDAVVECLRSGHVSQGKYVEQFQKDFSKFIGTKFSLAVSSGTAALHLALLALGIKKGDEVIVPAYTFIAPANAALYVGATPRFIDIEKGTFCLNPSLLENCLTDRTKAIIAVHLYGHSCDMNKITNFAKKHDLKVIEDCAQALGSEYKGKKVGNFSDVSCFSFYENKFITTGEGGMCCTNNKDIAKRIDSLRAQGKNPPGERKHWYEHARLGYNYRMTDLQASIGIAQLKKLENFIDKKNGRISKYKQFLEGLNVELPIKIPETRDIHWMHPILFESNEVRDKVKENLEKNNIPVGEMFYPCHKQLHLSADKLNLEVSELVFNRGIILPDSLEMSDKEIEFVVDKIKEVI